MTSKTIKNKNYNSKCSVCKSTQVCLKKYRNLYKTDSTVLYLCDICFQKVSLENYLTEFLQLDGENLNIVCKSCHKKFSFKKSLIKYGFSSAKGKNTQFMCETCVERLSNKERLKMVCLNYVWEVCKEVFFSGEELKIHHFTHTKKCKVCERCKIKISSARRHQSQLCEACEENLLLKKTLKQHCLTHKNKEVERKLSKTILKMHCLVLAPNTPFICGICKDGFSSKDEILQHYPAHTGEVSHKWRNCKETHSPFLENNKLRNCEETHSPFLEDNNRTNCKETQYSFLEDSNRTNC